jgi:hypothetical protein
VCVRNIQQSVHHHAPVQAAVGTTANVGTYSSGYVHPATVVIPPSVSCLLNHPSALFVTCAGAPEKLCGGSVIRGAVFVYVGNSVIATSKLASVVGGQGKDAVDDAGMVDGVPVCHGKYAEKDPAGAEREAHFPTATRGSVGIHPLR